MSASELLLSGLPMQAEKAATEALQTAQNARARVQRIRARVWVGDVRGATQDATHLDREQGFDCIGLSLVALAGGHPARARLLLEGEPPLLPADTLLFLITRAEVTRAAGDAGAALQHAGKAASGLTGLDPRWALYSELTLGRCLVSAGDLDFAKLVLDRATQGFRSLLPGTVALAEALDANAHLHRQRNDPFAAVLHHEEALSLWMQLGETSLPVATCTFQLAQARHRTGDFQTALETMEAAFLATHRALGPDHLDTWTTRFELGRMEVDAGDPFTGLPRMERARDEVAQRLGPQHPVCRAMGRYLPE